jgi:uncharacterized protein (TIGR03086 family)
VNDDAERHRRACAGFTHLVRVVAPTQWALPTPCREWDTRALLEHVIGFHEYLLLRPLGVRAHRPKDDPVGRWVATANAINTVLDAPEVLDESRDYFDGASRPPGTVLPALTTDVVVHTWDLSRAIGTSGHLDPELCLRAWEQASSRPNAHHASGLVAPPVAVPSSASVEDRLVGLFGRSPAWQPPAENIPAPRR